MTVIHMIIILLWVALLSFFWQTRKIKLSEKRETAFTGFSLTVLMIFMTATFYLLPNKQEQESIEVNKQLTETVQKNNALLEQQLITETETITQKVTETIPGLTSDELREIIIKTDTNFSIQIRPHKDIDGKIDGILGYVFHPDVENKEPNDYIQLHGFLQTDCSFAGQPGSLCDTSTGLYTTSTNPAVISLYEILKQKIAN